MALAAPLAITRLAATPKPHSCSPSPEQMETSMNSAEVERFSYEMPPRTGISVAHFLTVTDIERSLRFYERIFGGRILSMGEAEGAPGYLQLANTWLIVNVG